MLITVFLRQTFSNTLVMFTLLAVTSSAANAQSYTITNTFGSAGTGNGQFHAGSSFGEPNGPAFITLDSSNNIYVSDLFTNHVEKFSHSGGFLSNITDPGGSDGVNPSTPLGVTVDVGNNLFVGHYIHSATANGSIEKFDSAGNYLGVFASTKPLPYGLAFGSNSNLYVEDNLSYVQEFDKNNGSLLSTIGGPGTISSGGGIRFDSSGNLYVADGGSNRIEEFNSSGVFVQNIGSGLLGSPADVALDSQGNIYATDYTNSRIVEFNSSGVFVQNIGSGQLLDPYGLAFDSSGNLFVADRGNYRIVEFSSVPESSTLTIFGVGVSVLGMANLMCRLAFRCGTTTLQRRKHGKS